jgi:hypothetical protein
MNCLCRTFRADHQTRRYDELYASHASHACRFLTLPSPVAEVLALPSQKSIGLVEALVGPVGAAFLP